MKGCRTRGWDHAVGLVLCTTYVVVLIGTASDLAMSRDESFYFKAAQDYAAWFEQLLSEPQRALDRRAIDSAWDYNAEHPALMKSAFAVSWLAQKKWSVFHYDSTAFRFPGMLVAGLLLWLIYIWGTQVAGRAQGLFAAAAFALIPRAFYHAHLDCFDLPIAFFVALTAYCYWRSLSSKRWAILCGLAFGLALATKHNSWALPGIFAIHYVWFVFSQRGRMRAGISARTELFPGWLVAMVLIGPVIFFASWPWLWHDTLTRLGGYIGFHTHHVHYNYAYFGTSYVDPPLPISTPFVMTLFTVPATTLALAFGGIVSGWRRLLPPAVGGSELISDIPRTDVLWFGCLLAPLVIIALPTTPIFGGTKHWLTAYPFLALYAGVGFGSALTGLSSALSMPKLAWPLAGVLLTPAVVETAHSHPFALSHYTVAAGGVPGAADLGMNRQFWGFTTGSLVDWLKKELPHGGAVFICDTTSFAWSMLQRDGLLPKNIVATSRMADADLVLVHHEDHFVEVDFQAWVTINAVRPVKVLTYDGVPIISVYRNTR